MTVGKTKGSLSTPFLQTMRHVLKTDYFIKAWTSNFPPLTDLPVMEGIFFAEDRIASFTSLQVLFGYFER